ncbi:GGDEF domain-containing protein [Dactylosporangium fulvum]|uniref:Diguanylate cyclase n=1 Tax=Dactylosporangium fulvum TaxID=53359 RepID=A0ABY5W6Z5_9ACTN|nr:diguanylate cyclase [Dactylosporangium fulvum]UWP85101.1 diguanylate cyclase [Dactylosporangium fulvum]
MAYFLIVGGSVVGACGLLVPGFAGGTTAGVLATTATAGAMVFVGAVCRLAPHRVPASFWIAAPLIAIVLIGFLNLTTRDVSVSAHLYYLWPLLYSATFLRYGLAYLMLGATSLTDTAVTLTLQPVSVGATDAAALVTAYCVATLVVTKLRKRADALVATLELQAMTDPLTGLPNRRAFNRDLALALDTTRRSGAAHCLLLVDVDHFKTINDTWGHAAGDAVLVSVATALREVAGAADTVARLGGDEFAMVVRGDTARARRHAAALRDLVSRITGVPDGLPTLSIGLAATTSGTTDAEALLAAADRALYTAKLEGRDRLAEGDRRPTPAAVPGRRT